MEYRNLVGRVTLCLVKEGTRPAITKFWLIWLNFIVFNDIHSKIYQAPLALHKKKKNCFLNLDLKKGLKD